jgi:RimJ/RimL family protein N-acetyltransferase
MWQLRSERLIFHPWSLADLDDAVALWTNSEVMALLGGVLSHDAVAARLQREIASQAEHGFQYWRLTAEGAFVGACGLKLTEMEDGTRVTEMGFHLLPRAWGRGIATEASRAALGFAFARTAEVYAGHHPQNHSSRHVLAKLGFEHIGERFYPPTQLMHPWYCKLRLT